MMKLSQIIDLRETNIVNGKEEEISEKDTHLLLQKIALTITAL